MKFNRKGKTVFALALTACMAGMALSAFTPLLTASASEVDTKLKCTTNCECDKDTGYNKNGPCQTYTYTADKDTSWETLQAAAEKVKCTGWVFEGWYTSELEYKYWGDKDEVFGTSEDSVLYPNQDWKCALEFAEYYGDKCIKGVEGNTYADSSSSTSTRYLFKECFGRWLTKFKDEDCEKEKCVKQDNCFDKDKKIIEETKKNIKEKKVTQDNLSQTVTEKCKEEECKGTVTLYARLKPQTVQIRFLSNKSEEQKEKDAANPNRPGIFYGERSEYIRIYRQYGTPLGELFTNIGGMQLGRTLNGWRVEGQENELCKTVGQWSQHDNMQYWWCPKALKEGFVTNTPGQTDYSTKFDWSLDLVAMYQNEDTSKLVEQEKEEQESAQRKKSTLKSSGNGVIEKEHVHQGVITLKTATCKEEGIKVHYECSCGQKFWDYRCTQPIEEGTDLTTPKQHNVVYVKGLAATCTRQGSQNRYVCPTCGKVFKDQDCKEELTDYTTPVAEHTYRNGVCTVCGAQDPNKKVEQQTAPKQQGPMIDEEADRLEAQRRAEAEAAKKAAEAKKAQEEAQRAEEARKAAEAQKQEAARKAEAAKKAADEARKAQEEAARKAEEARKAAAAQADESARKAAEEAARQAEEAAREAELAAREAEEAERAEEAARVEAAEAAAKAELEAKMAQEEALKAAEQEAEEEETLPPVEEEKEPEIEVEPEIEAEPEVKAPETKPEEKKEAKEPALAAPVDPNAAPAPKAQEEEKVESAEVPAAPEAKQERTLESANGNGSATASGVIENAAAPEEDNALAIILGCVGGALVLCGGAAAAFVAIKRKSKN